MFFLQTITPEAEALAQKINPDSLAVKREVLIQTIKETPPEELLHNLLEQSIQFGLKVLAAFLIYLVGAWLIKLVKRSMKKGFARKNTEPTIASFSLSLVSISMWVVLIILTIGTLGVNTTSLAALLAAGGMAIGMALSGTVQNFAGGIMILLFRPFKAGDYIEALGYGGIVKEVTITNTKLTTPDNRIIILPNGALSAGNINNVTALPLRRVDLEISISYGEDAAKVKEAILEICSTVPGVLDSKTEGAADPFVALKDLGDSAIVFTVRCWVNVADYWPTRFALNEAIYTELPAKYGIGFPFPQLDVHIKKDA